MHSTLPHPLPLPPLSRNLHLKLASRRASSKQSPVSVPQSNMCCHLSVTRNTPLNLSEVNIRSWPSSYYSTSLWLFQFSPSHTLLLRCREKWTIQFPGSCQPGSKTVDIIFGYYTSSILQLQHWVSRVPGLADNERYTDVIFDVNILIMAFIYRYIIGWYSASTYKGGTKTTEDTEAKRINTWELKYNW